MDDIQRTGFCASHMRHKSWHAATCEQCTRRVARGNGLEFAESYARLPCAQEDSATSCWIVQYTKDCPECKTAINKDGGCNHMHCKQCDHHFCWVCLGGFGVYGAGCRVCGSGYIL